jgi:hypothetical protein
MDNVFSKAKDKINILEAYVSENKRLAFLFLFCRKKGGSQLLFDEKVQGFGIEVYDKAL